jgi:hypothetical protein
VQGGTLRGKPVRLVSPGLRNGRFQNFYRTIFRDSPRVAFFPILLHREWHCLLATMGIKFTEISGNNFYFRKFLAAELQIL